VNVVVAKLPYSRRWVTRTGWSYSCRFVLFVATIPGELQQERAAHLYDGSSNGWMAPIVPSSTNRLPWARLANDAAQNIALRYAQILSPVFIENWPTGTKFRSYSRSRSKGHLRSIHPHCLSANSICPRASTGHFEANASYSQTATLASCLQHAMLGVPLTLTQTGFTPASQSDLASPHVHFIRPTIWTGKAFSAVG